jgi:hypothetical protein
MRTMSGVSVPSCTSFRRWGQYFWHGVCAATEQPHGHIREVSVLQVSSGAFQQKDKQEKAVSVPITSSSSHRIGVYT